MAFELKPPPPKPNNLNEIKAYPKNVRELMERMNLAGQMCFYVVTVSVRFKRWGPATISQGFNSSHREKVPGLLIWPEAWLVPQLH